MEQSIYNNMMNNNTTWLMSNEFIFDSELNNTHDKRRTIALVAQGNIEYHESWKQLYECINTRNNKWMQPKLHHTFICISPWSDMGICIDECSIEALSLNIAEQLKGGYTIVFDRIIPVKTGFVLCGTSVTDINSVRDSLRAKGYIKGEQYHLDILHMTLLRNVAPLSQAEKYDIITRMSTFKQEPYITLHVNSINVTEASWTMKDNTFRILKEIIL